MMLLFYVITPLLISKNTAMTVIIKSSVLYIIFGIIHYFFGLFDDRIFVYYPFYIMGLLWVPISNKVHLIKKKIFLADTLLLFLFIIIILRVQDNMVIHIFTGILGLPFIDYISEVAAKFLRRVNVICAALGKMSMYIYLFHRQIYTALAHVSGIKEGRFPLAFSCIIALPVCLLYCTVIGLCMEKVSEIIYKWMSKKVTG